MFVTSFLAVDLSEMGWCKTVIRSIAKPSEMVDIPQVAFAEVAWYRRFGGTLKETYISDGRESQPICLLKMLPRVWDALQNTLKLYAVMSSFSIGLIGAGRCLVHMKQKVPSPMLH
jgi:hypothetical protein